MSYIKDKIKKESAKSPEFAEEFKKEKERLNIAVALIEYERKRASLSNS